MTEELRAPLVITLMLLLPKYSSISVGAAEDSKPSASSFEMVFRSRCKATKLGKSDRAVEGEKEDTNFSLDLYTLKTQNKQKTFPDN